MKLKSSENKLMWAKAISSTTEVRELVQRSTVLVLHPSGNGLDMGIALLATRHMVQDWLKLKQKEPPKSCDLICTVHGSLQQYQLYSPDKCQDCGGKTHDTHWHAEDKTICVVRVLLNNLGPRTDIQESETNKGSQQLCLCYVHRTLAGRFSTSFSISHSLVETGYGSAFDTISALQSQGCDTWQIPHGMVCLSYPTINSRDRQGLPQHVLGHLKHIFHQRVLGLLCFLLATDLTTQQGLLL